MSVDMATNSNPPCWSPLAGGFANKRAAVSVGEGTGERSKGQFRNLLRRTAAPPPVRRNPFPLRRRPAQRCQDIIDDGPRGRYRKEPLIWRQTSGPKATRQEARSALANASLSRSPTLAVRLPNPDARRPRRDGAHRPRNYRPAR